MEENRRYTIYNQQSYTLDRMGRAKQTGCNRCNIGLEVTVEHILIHCSGIHVDQKFAHMNRLKEAEDRNHAWDDQELHLFWLMEQGRSNKIRVTMSKYIEKAWTDYLNIQPW